MISGRERGMRSLGITHFRLKNMLQEWLDLSIQKSIPISLLIMSRAFTLSVSAEPGGVMGGKGQAVDHRAEDAVTSSMQSITSSMSSLDADIINEVS